jgi:hypothetical protein
MQKRRLLDLIAGRFGEARPALIQRRHLVLIDGANVPAFTASTMLQMCRSTLASSVCPDACSFACPRRRRLYSCR